MFQPDSVFAFGCYKEIKKRDKRTDSEIILILNYSGFSIDCGSAIKDSSIIEEGMSYAKGIFSKLNHNHRLYSNFGYNIANGYGSLLQIKQHSSEQHYWVGDDWAEEAKRLYRTLIEKIPETDVFILPILTNYANLLNGQLGRSLESLEYYNRALSIDPEFSMVLGNKGYVQSLFSSVIEGETKAIFLHEAYINLKKAIRIGLDVGPKNYFTEIMDGIKKIFPDVINLDENADCKNVLKDSNNFEHYYKRFCHTHNLYLNPISNIHKCEAALYDPLTIKKMIVKTGEDDKYFKFSSYFNQIKQEFVFARYLAAQSFHQDPKIKFLDEGVVLLDTLDYSAHNVYLEQARVSYRISYSILDKIAYVFNEYLNLGLKENSIYFYKLSPLFSDVVFSKLTPIQNPYISAILDLANDFRNGYFQKQSKIRNSFEHKFKSLHIYASPRRITPADEKYKESDMLTTKEFRNILIDLLKIVKSAIFYLALLIDWEERIKEKNINSILFPMYVFEIPDELKIE